MVDLTLRLTPFRFVNLEMPKGFLPADMRAHACWYYYTLAYKNYEQWDGGDTERQVVLEGEPWHNLNLQQIKKSVGFLYGIDPAVMDHFWMYVDQQASSMGLPILPKWCRLNSVYEVRH